MEERMGNGWRRGFVIAIVFFVAVVVLAAATGLWALTAIPIGFLFGFFLERSDLCGASAFSEVVMMKDPGKIWGIWVVIAVSMIMFTIGSAVGLIKLSPKPLLWANYVLGGAIFGVGTVLAGGCVSGCLFKAGQGNINSMAALVAMPIGMAAVAYGPLAGLNKTLSSYVIKGPDGGPVTLSALTGLPYWALAIFFCVVTLLVAAVWVSKAKRNRTQTMTQSRPVPLVERIFMRPWKPWHSGIAIGILALIAYTSSAASGRNYPLGVTHGVLFATTVLTESPVTSVWASSHPVQKVAFRQTESQTKEATPAQVSQGPKANPAPPTNGRKVVWWLVFLVTFVILGSYVSSTMRGSFNLRPKPPEQTIVAFVGGLLVGIGAWLATACVIGHIMSGVALMSVGSIIFAVTVVLANWVTTYAYLMGGFSR